MPCAGLLVCQLQICRGVRSPTRTVSSAAGRRRAPTEAHSRSRVDACVRASTGSVSEPARARVEALLEQVGGGADASDAEATVRSLQAQLASCQQELQSFRLESSKTIAAFRKVAEQLSEERLAQDADRAAKERELQSVIDAGLSRAAELEARVRVLELELAERPTREELSAVQTAAAARVADAEAGSAELSVQLSRMRDTVVSEQVEVLVAQVRALEVQLAERADAQQMSALEARIQTERARAYAAEAAASELATQAARQAAVTTRAPPRAPSDIDDQLRRIELLLQSIPEPTLSVKAGAAVAASAASGAGPVGASALPSGWSAPARSGQFLHPNRRRMYRRDPETGGASDAVLATFEARAPGGAVAERGDKPRFQRAPAGSFALRRHVFKRGGE